MYFAQFIIGGILFVLIYYFSQIKNSALAALIPAIPVMGLVGLYFISSNGKNDITIYIKSAILYFTLYVVMFSIMYFLYLKTNNLLLACICSCFIWIIMVFYYYFTFGKK